MLLATALTLPVIDAPWGERPWVQAVYLACVVLLEGLIALSLTSTS